MPRIPEYQSQSEKTPLGIVNGPRLEPQRVNYSAESFGAGTGQQLQQVGRELLYAGVTGMRMTREYNMSAAEEQRTATIKELTPLLHGKDGLFAKEGKQALDAPQQFAELMKTAREAGAKNLGNDLQKQFYNEDLDRFELQTVPQLERHSASQLKAYELTTAKDSMDTDMNAVAMNYTDPDAMRNNAARVMFQARRISELQGLSETSITKTVQEAVSSAYAMAGMQALSGGDVHRAQTILESGVIQGREKIQLTSGIRSEQKRMEAEARAQAERAQAARMDGMSQDVWQQTAGMDWAQRHESAIEYIAACTENPAERRVLLGTFEHDAAFQQIQEKARDNRQARDMVQRAVQNSIRPSEFLSILNKATDMTDTAKKLASDAFVGEIKETPATRAALTSLRVGIDQGKFRTPDEIEALAFDNRMTSSQVNAALTYLADGGKGSGVTVTSLERLWKSREGGKMPDAIYDMVIKQLPDGKKPSENELISILANLAMDGASKGSGTFSDSEKLYKAIQNNRTDTWLPEVTPEEEKNIADILKTHGGKIKGDRIPQYKKEHMHIKGKTQ